MQNNPQTSPHLRTLHPGSLQHLQQSPDGSLFPQTLPHAIYQQQQYALSGPPQPPPHAIHYGLPGSPAQYTAFPASYQHASSPRFAIANAPPLPLPEVIQHFQSPPRPTQRLSLPRPPIPTAPQQVLQRDSSVQAFQQRPPHQVEGDAQAREGDEAPSSNHGQFQGLKLVADPADLETWRQRLFDVDETITLDEEE